MSDIINKLNWRYATKKFDSQKKLTDSQLGELAEILRLSSSSFGLQPWKFVFIQDQSVKDMLKGAAFGQQQISDAPLVVVFCAQKSIDELYIKNYISLISKTRGISEETLSGFKDMTTGFINGLKASGELKNWMKKQVYIALGNFLTSCASIGIDTCPMEGFVPSQVDDILGLGDQGLESCLICPVGIRSDDDQYAKYKKVRYELNDLIIRI